MKLRIRVDTCTSLRCTAARQLRCSDNDDNSVVDKISKKSKLPRGDSGRFPPVRIRRSASGDSKPRL